MMKLLVFFLLAHLLFGLFPYPLLAAPVGQERQNTSSKSKDWWNRLKDEEQNLSTKRDERRNLVNQIENASENQQKILQAKIRQLNRELDLIVTFRDDGVTPLQIHASAIESRPGSY